MSVSLRSNPQWSYRPAWSVLQSREEFGGSGRLLSLSVAHGVRERLEGEGRAASEDTSGYRVVNHGDLVINRLIARDGAIAVAGIEGIISPAYWVLKAVDGMDARFFSYVLNSSVYLAEIGARSKFMPPAQFDLLWDQFRSLPLPCPSAAEQRAIADYLDTETARIDALIAKKQRMIELADERFISEVDGATSGCGWREARLRWCSRRIADGTHGTYHRQPSGHLLLSAKNLRNGRVTVSDDESYISEADYREISRMCDFRPGDVLFGVIGGSIGNVARMNEGDPTAFQRSVASVSPSGLLLSDFLYLVSLGRRFQDQLRLASNSSAQAGVYLGALGDIAIPLPDIDDQARIVEKLMQLMRAREQLAAALSRQIELLREQRQALITAAVTGELEVPGVAA